MKDIRPALRAYLLGDNSISGLVGGVRIHYGRLPQSQTQPSVVFNKITETSNYTMAGDAQISQVRMQVDAWAQTADAATELSNAVYDRISGAYGEFPVDSDSITVRGIFLANGRDDYDSVAQLYRASRDYFVWYLT